MRPLKLILALPLHLCVYVLACCIPKDRNRWIFNGWRKSKEREIFAENPKYLFLYAATFRPSVRPIWIGEDVAICKVLRARGYEAYPRHSLSGIWHSLRAFYTYVGAFMRIENWRLSGGSNVIQLWHSKSLKKTGHESPYGLRRYARVLHPNLFMRFFRFVAISDYLARFAIQDFRLDQRSVMVTGIPKHDVLVSPMKDADIDVDRNLEALVAKARARNPNRLIFYGPTFRTDGVNPLEKLDLEKLDAVLSETNDMLILSLHPKFAARDWIPEGEAFSRILFSQSDYDIYPILPSFDLLITDYSSLSFDFLFMDKPVILFAFDYEEFKKGMGLYDELWNIIPGPKVFTFEALAKALKENAAETFDRSEARKTLFAYLDGSASRRIVEALR